MMAEFMAENSNIKIAEESYQINDYNTKISALAATGNMPDIFLVKGDQVLNYVNNELVADITDEVKASENYSKYREGTFDRITQEGVIYGVPNQYSSSTLVFYNKDLWKEAGYDSFPATWDEVFEASKYFTEKGIYTLALGDSNLWQYESSVLSALGDRFTGSAWTKSIIDMDGAASFTDENFVKSLELTAKLGTSGMLNPDYATIDNQAAASQFIQGKAAATIDGYWNISYLNANADENFVNNVVGIAALPDVSSADQVGQSRAIAAGCGWFTSINPALEGAKREAAIQFLLKMTGPDTAQTAADKYGQMTAMIPESMDPSKFPSNVNVQYMELAEASPVSYIYDSWMDASVMATMQALIPEVLAGSVSPADAAEQIQAEYEAAVANMGK